MKNILTRPQVAQAIYVDSDYNPEVLDSYAVQASSFIKQKTGYDFAQDNPVEPLAILAAEMYVKQIHFNGQNYNKEFDYSFGLRSTIQDLQDIAQKKLTVITNG